jgi:hypothetical protein
LLRLPFVALPYLAKLSSYFLLRRRYAVVRAAYWFQAIGILGDFANLLLTPYLIVTIIGLPEHEILLVLLRLSTLAEYIRLISEKGQMIWSAVWQMLPHRAVARWLRQAHISFLARYTDYYALSDTERMACVIKTLKALAHTDKDVYTRLAYFNAFRIVPHINPLRCDRVRDVARGEVFIHRNWTSDPWLLIGQVMRRAPWMFDPRYLRRPFYYRTESNRLATLFVLQHPRYSPPYVWYQFGHEIKASRYDFLYRILRRLGFNLEEPVCEDGTYRFDRLIGWLEDRLGLPAPEKRPLWNDKEVVVDVLKNGAVDWSAQAIAERYTYPLIYVEEVLMEKIRAAQFQANADLTTLATRSGASQWG